MSTYAQPDQPNSSGANLGLWAFRFVLWYICIYLVQPQHRFPFLIPFRIANTAFIAALGLYFVYCAMTKQRLFHGGASSKFAVVLLSLAIIANMLGAYKVQVKWGGELDVIVKNCAVVFLLEALLTSVQRIYGTLLTVCIASLWWFKAGVRGMQQGGTYELDRIMGPAVGLVQGPNEFGVFMSALVPLLLAMFLLVEGKSQIKWLFLAGALTALFVVLETGSRTGLLCLMLLGLLIFPRLAARKASALLIIAVAAIFAATGIKEGNRERLRTLPSAVRSFFQGTPDKPYEEMNRDERSAEDRRQKDLATWKLIRDNPVFGAGPDAADWAYPEEYSAAQGVVHNEFLMAGRQMGYPGMALMIAMYSWIILGSWGVQRRMKVVWPELSSLAWGMKVMACLLFFGGLFSTSVWNIVLMVLLVCTSRLRALTKTLKPGAPLRA